MVQVNVTRFVDFSRTRAADGRSMRRAVRRVLESGHYVGGPEVGNFEKAFADFLGVRHVVGTGNGFDALHIALAAMGVGAGDEVIVPGFSYAATWLAVHRTGATIVPVDVKEEDAVIDASLIEAAITGQTKAILPVHLYGNPAPMHVIRRLAKKHSLMVLDDAAQAHGLKIDGLSIGSLSDVAAFSFYPTKNLGGFGDGGAIATNSDSLAGRARSLSNYGTDGDKFTFVEPGLNSRLDPVQAAYLTLRLRHLQKENHGRQRAVKRIRKALSPESGRVMGPDDVENSVWHVCSIRTRDKKEFVERLARAGIPTDHHYPYSIGDLPFLLSTPSRDGDPSYLSVSKLLADAVVSVPVGRWVSPGQQRRLIRALS